MIVVVGVSYRTAPIEVRERSSLSEDDLPALLAQLRGCGAVREAFVVSTCNRVEVVAVGAGASMEALEAAALACRGALAERHPDVGRYLYMHLGHAAVQHLFKVACSLDSLVVGEPQILGQLKQAFERARKLGAVGAVLNRTFPRAVRAAKRVRTETALGAGQVSVPTVAVELARQIFSDLRGRKVALVGAGEMGRSVARLLVDAGAQIVVYGRNLETAQAFAVEIGGEARALDGLGGGLVEADVVVSSTSAPHYVVTREMLAAVKKARRGRNLFLIDLAVPRDVEPSAGAMDGTFLYNIDDLSHVVEESITGRQREAEQAARILDEETRGFERWMEAEQATPVIKALRARLRGALEVEFERSMRGRLRELGPEQRVAVAKMLDAALNRMLHLPTSRLREEALGEGPSLEQLSETLDELFALQDLDAEALDAPGVRIPTFARPSDPPSLR